MGPFDARCNPSQSISVMSAHPGVLVFLLTSWFPLSWLPQKSGNLGSTPVTHNFERVNVYETKITHPPVCKLLEYCINEAKRVGEQTCAESLRHSWSRFSGTTAEDVLRVLDADMRALSFWLQSNTAIQLIYWKIKHCSNNVLFFSILIEMNFCVEKKDVIFVSWSFLHIR